VLRSVALLLLVCVAACSSSEDTSPAPFKAGTSSSSSSSGSSPGDDDDDDTVILPPAVVEDDAGTPPPADQASSFRGVLAATPATKFGGVAPHCTYNATMKKVEVELAITPSGNVIAGSAKSNYVETVVGTCALAALGTVPQTFTLTTTNGTELTFRGVGGPKTALVLKLTKAGASWDAAATWTRTDRTDDLKWVVKSNVTLGPK